MSRRLTFLLAVALVGCSHAPERTSTPAPSPAPQGTRATAAANDVLFRALALVGTPYRYGGNTPEGGFDCSGLVGYVFRDTTGIVLPRTSAAIADMDLPRVDGDELRGGDLVLFGSRRTISHVGIYVGQRRFVHAPNSGGTVRLDSLDAAGWRDTFRHGQRVLR
jgi:cell wall-associated NlpC family hydrolase